MAHLKPTGWILVLLVALAVGAAFPARAPSVHRSCVCAGGVDDLSPAAVERP